MIIMDVTLCCRHGVVVLFLNIGKEQRIFMSDSLKFTPER